MEVRDRFLTAWAEAGLIPAEPPESQRVVQMAAHATRLVMAELRAEVTYDLFGRPAGIGQEVLPPGQGRRSRSAARGR